MIQNTLSKQPYDNILVISEDGEKLFYCDRKKANFYLKNDLAENINDNKIKLTFEPAGRGDENPTPRKNICICCGTDQQLTKHHVIPHAFVKRSKVLKRLVSHKDVVVLCKDCHDEYENKMGRLFRWNLLDILDLPADSSDDIDWVKVEKEQNYAQCKAQVLISKNPNIPDYVIEELTETVAEYLEIDPNDITDRHLNKVLEEPKRMVGTYHNIEQYIIENYKGDLIEFCDLWRNNFVRNMKPVYLPTDFPNYDYLVDQYEL